LKHAMIVHCAELAPFAESWRRVHTRPTYPVPGVRFYANASNAAYEPTTTSAADALTTQALTTVDFPRTIRRAWDDGIHVFLELGPRDTLTSAIARILHDRPHVAIALDATAASNASEPARIAHALARLHVAGIDINPAALSRVF